MIIFSLLLGIMADPEALVQSKVDVFIFECFEGDPPSSEILIIEEEKRDEITRFIISHELGEVFSYWKNGNQSVWILNRKGQERLITLGIFIENSQIKKVEVIQYREERGWEIKTPRFLAQFNGYSFNPIEGGSARIDGISGASLSVDVVKDSAIIALQLDALVQKGNQGK